MEKLLQLIVLLSLISCNNNPIWIINAPANTELTKIDKTGTTVIPNGRFITPLGKSIVTAPHPYGLTLSPDGNTAVTANSGTGPLSITIVRKILSDNPEVQAGSGRGNRIRTHPFRVRRPKPLDHSH